jgi:hypothetical protein
LWKDRLHRAFIDAEIAVDAGVGIDEQLIYGGEVGFILGRVNAVHWADRNAGCVFRPDARTEAGVQLTPQMEAHHFVWAVAKSKWNVLRGWHLMRHSFASNCTLKGLDGRMISAWMGHVTR